MARTGRKASGVSLPMVRHGVAALGLVLLMASGFALLGARAQPSPIGAADNQEAEPDAADVDAADAGGKVLGAPLEPPATDGPDASGEETDGETGNGAEDTPEEPERIPPETIDIQVLDGYREDGGTAASDVADELRSLGYVIAAENPAIAYEETTVLWNEGFEEEARQVAEDLGVTEIRVQPGNLSAGVTVHIVVGADRG
ncbi:MAG: LytR C-terminal domain-containing protein [Nitriliruptoraceae bacterium]